MAWLFVIIGFIVAVAGLVALCLGIANDKNVAMWVSLGFIVFIAGFFMMGFGLNKADRLQENACNEIGGEYVVVDKQWSGDVYVDMYGCVKK